MIKAHKTPTTVRGKVTSNDGTLAIVTMPSTETLRILRFFTASDEGFKAQWTVGKEVTVENRK